MDPLVEYTLQKYNPDPVAMREMMREGWEMVWVFYDEGAIEEALWRKLYDARPREYDVAIWNVPPMSEGTWLQGPVLVEDHDDDYPRCAFISYKGE